MMSYKRTIIIFITILTAVSLNAQTLCIEITNIRNNNGKILIAVFKDNESFKKEKPVFDKQLSKKNLKNGTITTKINIAPGTYGITVLDDENNNGKMEYKFIRIPKEGFGFSNYYHTGMSRPKFKDFDFIIKTKDKFIKIKMKYL